MNTNLNKAANLLNTLALPLTPDVIQTIIDNQGTTITEITYKLKQRHKSRVSQLIMPLAAAGIVIRKRSNKDDHRAIYYYIDEERLIRVINAVNKLANLYEVKKDAMGNSQV